MSTDMVAKLKIGLNGIVAILSLVLGLLVVGNPVFSAYAQVFPPSTTFPQQGFLPAPSQGFLPPPQTTFPPSVFPPTQSALPPTSFAVPTGSLSPWFPSVPAIACGGTFTFTIVGDFNNKDNNNNNNKDNNNNNNSDGKRTIALQIQAAGGTDLNQNSISGQIFKGKDNIKHNDGQDFTIRGVSNNCQVPMFTK
ncbi:MAG: hypothetical protein ACJ71K_00950 [Nitrososphaeraceae archaeon]